MDAVTLTFLEPLLTCWLAAMGLVIGSFLNVVIARVPEGLSIVRPGSRCPRCGHPLAWWENIPVVSWVLLRGRCHGCRAPISLRYPLVELLTGFLFLGCLLRFGWTWELARALMLVILLIPLSLIDLDHWILPFELTLPGIVLGIALAIPGGQASVLDAVLGAVVGFAVFWALEWVGEKIFKKEALGGGDKYLLAMLGAFLSWRALLGIIFLASLQGAVVGLVMIALFGRAGPQAPAAEPGPSAPPPDPGAIPAADAIPAASATATAAAAPLAADEEEDDWVPGPTNMPFGPWLAVAGLELMLLGEWLADRVPWSLAWMVHL